MRPFGPTARAALGLVLCVALIGCGEALESPPASLPTSSCPHIDETLAGTLAAIRDGEVAPVASLFQDLSQSNGDDALALVLRTILALVRVLGPFELDANSIAGAIDLETISALEQGLARAITPFIEAPAGSDKSNDHLLVFDALAEVILECPEGSLTSTVRMVTGDNELTTTLLDLAADPRFFGFFEPLPR